MKKHHLLIAGTGRAGTTFLVEYLAACGLETQLARDGAARYDEAANAGLEDTLLGQSDAPYVCKSPWLFEYVERLLADESIAIDAVIVPMRSLVEAASSRVVNELRARVADLPPGADAAQWASWGTTPGGVVYSLNPIDQARLLALGFHELLHALVKRGVPVCFLDFPRFIDDPDYLYRALHGVLAGKVEQADALRAHERLAAPDKVRLGKELAIGGEASRHGNGHDNGDEVKQSIAFPSHAELDRIALSREVAQLKRQLDKAQARLHRAASIEASTSWRVTAPLRALVDLMKHGTSR